MTGGDLAASAAALVGTPFRLNGRDPATGLDCIGLLAAALGRPDALPTGYTLRLRDHLRWLPDPEPLGFVMTEGDARPGDVVLLRVGPTQHHLAIAAAPAGWLHAHAGLRRVVRQPSLPDGERLGHWRLIDSKD